MPHIEKKRKEALSKMFDEAENLTRNFRSVAAEMYKFAPRKLNQSQKNKVRDIAKTASEIISDDFKNARKAIKKHYTQEDWERDCQIVENILTFGTAKIVLHAQEILNECNGDFGKTLEDSLDTTVVPTLRLAMKMIRVACDMVNYTETCLSEAFHDDWDLIVEIDDIIPEKALTHYRKACEKLDADMRKNYRNKKLALEKKYGDKIHRSVCPNMDYTINVGDDTETD